MNHSTLQRVRLGIALRQACLDGSYNVSSFVKDLIAGLTVGIIAIPLSMALAIASGVPPQHGLYTAVIAGILIAVTGGSRYSISGPTAAFVVILYPVSQQFGIAGLLMATLLSGIMLVVMGMMRLGRLIEYIPPSVTLGFTGGIAIVIGTMQIKDLFGLTIHEMPESYLDKAQAIIHALPSFDWADSLVGLTTLAVLLLWPRLKLPIPGHLPAVLVGVGLTLLLSQFGADIATIGNTFHYQLADGSSGNGIPNLPPSLMLPWTQLDASGETMPLTLATFQKLLPAAFSMAMLGAIESLLCAVVLDGMTGKKHSSNAELVGQGIGNIVAPFFGGITATAALARSATNVRAGAVSPLSSVIHALVVLAALLILAPWLSWLPLASMSALLLLVAWNMSEAHKIKELVRQAPRSDVLVLIVCLLLTVLFDMVIAITFGVILASLLFMREVAKMTRFYELGHDHHHLQRDLSLPPQTTLYKINGPLFFAAAERIFGELLEQLKGQKVLVLHMEAVTVLDAGGLSAFMQFVKAVNKEGVALRLVELQFQPLKTLARAKVEPIPGKLEFFKTLDDAMK